MKIDQYYSSLNKYKNRELRHSEDIPVQIVQPQVVQTDPNKVIRNFQNEITKMEARMKEKREECNQLQDQIHAAETSIQVYRDQFDIAQNEIYQIKEAIAGYHAKINTLQTAQSIMDAQ